MRHDGKLLHYISKAERRSGMLRGTGEVKRIPPEGIRGFEPDPSTPGIDWPRSVEREPDTPSRADD